MFSNLNDGYCPQCLLDDKKIDLKLNFSDFWECNVCNLQLCVIPPLAIVLRFRGKGEFRKNPTLGTENIVGVILAKADKNKFYLDKGLINKQAEFEKYLKNEVKQIPKIMENKDKTTWLPVAGGNIYNFAGRMLPKPVEYLKYIAGRLSVEEDFVTIFYKKLQTEAIDWETKKEAGIHYQLYELDGERFVVIFFERAKRDKIIIVK